MKKESIYLYIKVSTKNLGVQGLYWYLEEVRVTLECYENIEIKEGQKKPVLALDQVKRIIAKIFFLQLDSILPYCTMYILMLKHCLRWLRNINSKINLCVLKTCQ